MPKQREFIVEHYFCSSSYTTIKIRFRQEFPNEIIPADYHMEYTLFDLPRMGWPLALTAEEI